MAAFLSACSGGGDDRTSPPPSATAETTSSTSWTSSTTTTVAPATTVTTRPPATSAASPEGQARALYDAWTRGDRAGAGRVAQAAAVTDLFARPWQAGAGWSFAECTGAAGSVICTWQRSSGQQLLMRAQSATGGQPATVAEVRFQD